MVKIKKILSSVIVFVNLKLECSFFNYLLIDSLKMKNNKKTPLIHYIL